MSLDGIKCEIRGSKKCGVVSEIEVSDTEVRLERGQAGEVEEQVN